MGKCQAQRKTCMQVDQEREIKMRLQSHMRSRIDKGSMSVQQRRSARRWRKATHARSISTWGKHATTPCAKSRRRPCEPKTARVDTTPRPFISPLESQLCLCVGLTHKGPVQGATCGLLCFCLTRFQEEIGTRFQWRAFC